MFTQAVTNLWNRLLLENVIVTQLRNPPSYIEPEVSLPWSQEPAAGPCTEPDESSPHIHTVFL
jgi:hypothetical protein